MAQEKEKEEKKVKRPTARKRLIQSETRRVINRAYASSVKTAIRSLADTVPAGDAAEIQAKLSKVYSLVDKGVKAKQLKPNKANRIKARLTKKSLKAKA